MIGGPPPVVVRCAVSGRGADWLVPCGLLLSSRFAIDRAVLSKHGTHDLTESREVRGTLCVWGGGGGGGEYE